MVIRVDGLLCRRVAGRCLSVVVGAIALTAVSTMTGCGGGSAPSQTTAAPAADANAQTNPQMMMAAQVGSAPGHGAAPGSTDPAAAMNAMTPPAAGGHGATPAGSMPTTPGSNPMAMAAGGHSAIPPGTSSPNPMGSNPTAMAAGHSAIPPGSSTTNPMGSNPAAMAAGHSAIPPGSSPNPMAVATNPMAAGHSAIPPGSNTMGTPTNPMAAGHGAMPPGSSPNPMAVAGNGTLTPAQYAQAQAGGSNPMGVPGAANPMGMPPGSPMANPMAMAAGQPGSGPMPGMVPGAAGPGGGGAAPPPGTAEFAAYEFILAITKGEYEKLDGVISSKATGQLKDMKNNSLGSAKKDELKQELATPNLTNTKNVPGGKQFTLRSGQTIVSVTVKKEGDDFKVVEFSRTKARR